MPSTVSVLAPPVSVVTLAGVSPLTTGVSALTLLGMSLEQITQAAAIRRRKSEDTAHAEERLHELIREAWGEWSPQEIAKAAGMSRARVYQIKEGKR